MVVSFLVSSLATYFAFLQSRYNYKDGLKIAFIIIFIFLALRYDFGNDYMAYVRMYDKINGNYNFTFSWFPDGEKSIEPGWVLLNKLFSHLGFYNMIILLAAINSVVLYRFVKRYVEPKYFWIAIFIYVFQPYFMLILSSAMRQNVALLCFIVSIDFIIKKKVLQYLAIIYLATLFHSSAYVLFPFILLGHIRIRVNYIFILIICYMIYFIVANKELIFNFFIDNLLKNENQLASMYKMYFEEQETSYSWGAYPMFLLFIIIIWFSRNFKGYEIPIGNLAIVYIIVSFISFALPMVSRIGLYFQMALLIVYPLLMKSIKVEEIRISYILLLVSYNLYQYYSFFTNDDWLKKFGEYKTIFTLFI